MKRILTIFVLLFFSTITFAQIDSKTICSQSKISAFQKSKKNNSIQYPGDSNIDVTYYKLDITVNYDKNASPAVYLNGTVTINAKAVGNISSVFFDLRNHMTINELKVNGAEASYTHNHDIVTITLNSAVNDGDEFVTEITYEGTPLSSSLGSFGYSTTYDAIWTLSEPYGSSDWWVCKDTPDDKPDSADIWITTSTNLVPASNGSLEAIVQNGNGTHTYKWHESYPIAQYLISMAIAPYATYEQYYHYSPTDSMQVIHYNYPQNHTQSRINSESETVNMLEVFSDLFGQYPFIKEKYGHAEFIWSGAMEHQTLTSIGYYGRATIVHELAHQWFGDMITCADWQNIWLNEGFATYCESLYFEKVDGYDAFIDDVLYNMGRAKSANGSIYVQNINSENEIFSSVRSYSKGSIVLHMLRGVIGDENFFKTMYDYAHDPQVRFNAAVTEDFQRVAETVSGMDLDWFFHEWIYEEGYPQYSYAWSGSENGGNYSVTGLINQNQTVGPTFKMPVELVVEYTDGTEESFTVWDSTASQQFEISTSKEPFNVKFDPNNWILKDVEELLINPPLDKGILLVNGLSWNDAINEAYSNKAFWGNLNVSYWDVFDTPANGYPDTLPEAIGNGTVDIGAARRYSTLLWISGGSDNGHFDKNLMKSYLDAGGNIVLLTNSAESFIDDDLKEYIGLDWSASPFSTLKDFISQYNGLSDIAVTSNQVFVKTFKVQPISANSTLLYTSSEGLSEPVGVGIISQPEGKGKFVLLTCKPNLFNYSDLSVNIEYIVSNLIGESTTGVDDDKELVKEFALEAVYPNPFNPSSNIQFSLPTNELVNISVYDIIGQKVDELVNENMESGVHKIEWSAANLSSGVYLIRLNAGKFNAVQKAILLK